MDFGMKSVLQITLGILLAGLVTLLVRIGYLSYIEYRLTQGLNEFAMQQKQTELARQQAVKERKIIEYQQQQIAMQQAAERYFIGIALPYHVYVSGTQVNFFAGIHRFCKFQ